MAREVTQRELRNESGEIMRHLDDGESFIVTRNGSPVGELIPLRGHASSVPRRSWPCSQVRRRSTGSVSGPISTPSPTRTQRRVAEADRRRRGLLDTSVIIGLEAIEVARLPVEAAISALTLAELAAGPHASPDATERARRQDRLQRGEAAFEPLPFDGEAARAYGRIYAAVATAGRKARGASALDLCIAATALAADIALYTRNGRDFAGLDGLVDVIAV